MMRFWIAGVGSWIDHGRAGTYPVLLLILLLGLALPAPSAAQETASPVPRIADAELIFDQGLEAFRGQDYGMAYRRFRLVFGTFDLNRKTTAAYLMAAKALYRQGQYRQAVDLLDTLVERYPSTGYGEEARRLRTFALEQLDREQAATETIELGILLPRTERDAELTQALFNGVRLAVDAFNARAEGRRVRMLFFDTDGVPSQAAQGVTDLAARGADVIIGPLYSAEARAAARTAERAGVVLVAPMATDEDVSEGRQFVFQANPTITMRGRQMARFAMRSLMLDDFGVIVAREEGGIGERMAEGFQQEVVMQQAELDFYVLLEGARGWSQLSETVGADSLARVRAVYMPVTGGRAEMLIEAALIGLERMNANVRVLGNAEWHDLPFKQLASKFRATYSNDFYVDPAGEAVRSFTRRYRDLAGAEPDPAVVTGRLAFTGYDLARFLLEHLADDGAGSLPERLRRAPLYQGLGLRLDFGEDNVNEAMYFHRYEYGRSELVR